MIGAGQRDRRVRIERKVTDETDEGVDEGFGWAPIGIATARVFYGTGAERRNDAATGATQVATFNMLATAALRTVTVAEPECRIFDLDYGQAWDITAIANPNRREIEFTATQVRA